MVTVKVVIALVALVTAAVFMTSGTVYTKRSKYN